MTQLADPKGGGGHGVMPRDPDFANNLDTVPKNRLCDCCAGKDQKNYEPLRYRPRLKLWLCETCRDLREADLVKEDTRPDRTGKVRSTAPRRKKGGKR